MTNLKEGDKAPDFSGLNEKGKKVSLKNFKGKKLILFFYPQDNTPTCTIEACNLRDNFKLLKKKGFLLQNLEDLANHKTLILMLLD